MKKPTKEEIDAHIAACTDGDACLYRRARAHADRSTPPTAEEMSDLLINFHILEEYARDVIAADDQKSVWIAALLAMHGDTFLTNAELEKQADALVTLEAGDEGLTLVLTRPSAEPEPTPNGPAASGTN